MDLDEAAHGDHARGSGVTWLSPVPAPDYWTADVVLADGGTVHAR